MIKIASRGQKTSEEHVEAFLCNHSRVHDRSLVQLIVFTLPFLPLPAQYVHRQLKSAKKKGLRSIQFAATTHCCPTVTESWMSSPIPKGLCPICSPTLPPLPQLACTQPPIRQSLLLLPAFAPLFSV